MSVNNCVAHFSPLSSDPLSAQKLAKGDVVKLHLGAHIDDFAVIAAKTIVVGATPESPVTGRRADALRAAWATRIGRLRRRWVRWRRRGTASPSKVRFSFRVSRPPRTARSAVSPALPATATVSASPATAILSQLSSHHLSHVHCHLSSSLRRPYRHQHQHQHQHRHLH
ncbi:hypothetical protein F5148DRAFT_400430 [Russula earlei]|uniref:Uncharacterized protein n=1 Tax=Russula earlei TaxID=71964 RepID=A0ACC0U017_9AGAM|nr:hypothetical protein F5148DRAFT_400430 [Russula earlei]